MTTEEKKAIANRWAEEVYKNKNLDAVDKLLSPDFTFNYAPPGIEPTREGYKQNVSAFSSSFPDRQWNTEDMIAEGDKVVLRWIGKGTHKGEFMGGSPTGKEMTITGISIIRIKEGKILEEYAEMNMLGVMQQLGIIPSS